MVVVLGHPAFDDHAGVLGEGGRQVQPCHRRPQFAGGHHPPLAQHHDVVGEAHHFLAAWLT